MKILINKIPNISIIIVQYKEKYDQELIGNMLMNYDKCIVNNNKRIKILEQMAENLYKEWFVRFRFPGYEEAEFDFENPRGWIFGNREQTLKPKKWHYGELNELGEFKRGKNITAEKMIEGNVPVISARWASSPAPFLCGAASRGILYKRQKEPIHLWL